MKTIGLVLLTSSVAAILIAIRAQQQACGTILTMEFRIRPILLRGTKGT